MKHSSLRFPFSELPTNVPTDTNTKEIRILKSAPGGESIGRGSAAAAPITQPASSPQTPNNLTTKIGMSDHPPPPPPPVHLHLSPAATTTPTSTSAKERLQAGLVKLWGIIDSVPVPSPRGGANSLSSSPATTPTRWTRKNSMTGGGGSFSATNSATSSAASSPTHSRQGSSRIFFPSSVKHDASSTTSTPTAAYSNTNSNNSTPTRTLRTIINAAFPRVSPTTGGLPRASTLPSSPQQSQLGFRRRAMTQTGSSSSLLLPPTMMNATPFERHLSLQRARQESWDMNAEKAVGTPDSNDSEPAIVEEEECKPELQIATTQPITTLNETGKENPVQEAANPVSASNLYRRSLSSCMDATNLDQVIQRDIVQRSQPSSHRGSHVGLFDEFDEKYPDTSPVNLEDVFKDVLENPPRSYASVVAQSDNSELLTKTPSPSPVAPTCDDFISTSDAFRRVASSAHPFQVALEQLGIDSKGVVHDDAIQPDLSPIPPNQMDEPAVLP